jgi:Rho GTPase-activating protein 1
MNFVNRLRANSIPLNTIPPSQSSEAYSPELATLAVRILYRSPLPSPSDRPIFVLNSAAFPDAKQDYYDDLLPYVLARLPSEEDLILGEEYEIIFFAGGNPGSSYNIKKARGSEDEDSDDGGGTKPKRPGFGWFMRAYKTLHRIARKRLQKLWIVHEKGWVRVLVEMFATVVSPKFRKKVVHGMSPFPCVGVRIAVMR